MKLSSPCYLNLYLTPRDKRTWETTPRALASSPPKEETLLKPLHSIDKLTNKP